MAIAQITETDIRTFCMDRKELNSLLRGVRWSTEDIDNALNRCTDFFNETAPFVVSFTPQTFPYRYTLLIGVAGHLLRSASINEASNQLDYSADGVTVQDKNKAQIFASIGNQFWEEFKDKVVNIKITINVANAFGTMPSELIYVAR
jgi:hypothetical protein